MPNQNEDPFINGVMEPSEFKVGGIAKIHLTIGDVDTDPSTSIPPGKLRVKFKVPSGIKLTGIQTNDIWKISRGLTYLTNIAPVRFWELQEVFISVRGGKTILSGEIVATIGYNNPISAMRYGDLIKANDTSRIEFTVNP